MKLVIPFPNLNGTAVEAWEWISYVSHIYGACDVRKITTITSEWARRRLKSPASRLFTQPFIQAEIKENIKAPRHWPLWGEFTGDRWIPRTKGQ